MKLQISEFNIGIENDLVTPESPNFRPPSWPPPRDWPVTIDRNGVVISRWSDPVWDLGPWAKRRAILNFVGGKGSKAALLSSENADLMRMIATWMIWGPQAIRSINTLITQFSNLRQIAALCSRNEISAAKLMRFQNVFDQLPKVIKPSAYEATITQLHYLYDARDVLGFTIVDQDGLRRLASSVSIRKGIQTPYIPPRIWHYQVTRLHECMTDFLAKQQQLEACFRFCLNHYINQYGSLEAALIASKSARKGPFSPQNKRNFVGSFSEIAAQFGIAEVLIKWVGADQKRFQISNLSYYFSLVTYAGLAYIANFTLQRREEVASLRTSCLHWEKDEKLGRVPIICGESTKTDPDSDARWVASPSVQVAIQAVSAIARLRMECDCVNPSINPTTADQSDPYLWSTATEPWGSGLAHVRRYEVRKPLRNFIEALNGPCMLLFDQEQLKITIDDLTVARRLTPNLPKKEFAIGKVWPLTWHQYRRTGAVNMFASGDISDSSIQQQMKHSSRLMPLYYGRNHSRLNFNKEVQTAVVIAMYEAQVEIVKAAASGDRFASPHSPQHKEALVVKVLSSKDTKALVTMAKKGILAFREHRLGGCMKAGVCEYGGIESVARCAGGDGAKPCIDVLYDRTKEHQVRADMRRVAEEIKLLTPGQPRHAALVEEHLAMENYLNVISAC